jgi:hypothetical protein
MNIQNEKVPVKVKFIKPTYKDGTTEILALFVDRELTHDEADKPFPYIACYAHIGQHSNACKSFLRRKLATKEEYLPLLRELESLGYVVTAVNNKKDKQ